MTRRRRRAGLGAVFVAIVISALGLLPAPAVAADTSRPRIVAASMRDSDSDGKADRMVLTYNEQIRHPADDDGNYPFSLSGPRYGIRRVQSARGTRTLVILLQERSSPDPSAQPDISYVRGKPQPVRDMAGNEARIQTFASVVSLPCTANTSTDFYANPVVNRTARPAPTGVSSPPWCAYRTLTFALSALQADGGSGRVIATGAGTGTAIFASESFPLSLPEGVELTTTLDPDLGGTAHDATKYVVRFKGSASHAVTLTGGEMSGFTVTNGRSVPAASMVNCGAGASEITTVVLDGAATVGGEIADGLVLSEGCTLTDGLSLETGGSYPDNGAVSRVRFFADTGVMVEDGAVVDLFHAKIYSNGGDGLWVQGAAHLDLGEIAFNGDDGIFVDHSAPTSIHGVRVRDNLDNGVQVDGGDASFTSNQIWNNSRTAGWDSPQVLYHEAPPADGANTFLVWTGTTCAPAYGFGFGFADACTDEGPVEPYPGQDCGSITEAPNQVHTYNTNNDPAGSAERTVGLYAADGALVWADNNSWRTADQSQNVDSDAGSYVDADLICPPGGILLQDMNTSNEPVE